MKMILPLLALAITLPAQAMSPQLAKTCGTLHVEHVTCITAPCYSLLSIHHVVGKVDLVSPPVSNDEAWDKLEKMGDGESVCVEGFWQDMNKKTLSVLNADQAVAG
jgi:hypothetical protein